MSDDAKMHCLLLITRSSSTVFITTLVLLVVLSSGGESNDYFHKREKILQEESKQRTGASIQFSQKELLANSTLMKLKNDEISRAREDENFSPSINFLVAKPEIEKSEVFNIIKLMPKGAVLHGHDVSMVNARWLVKHATYQHNCYMCYKEDGSILFHFYKSPPVHSDCSWKTVTSNRNKHANVTDFDKELYEAITIDRTELVSADQTVLWQAFQKAFQATFGLVSYAPIFRTYFYQALSDLYADNVLYAEIRCLLPAVYELDGKTHDKDWVLNMYRDVTQQFIETHPDFIGIKIIYAVNRKSSRELVGKAVKEAIKLRERHSDILVGMDLVGREDKGYPLIYFVNELLQPSREGVTLPYFFHAGETDWQGTEVDNNIIDALLLNASRIGHGYALTKHPQAMKLVREKNVAIEVNPISNQVLGLVKDLRNHPAAELMSQGYPVVISNDDPAMWGATGLSYDFYEAFMGLGGAQADLGTLKQLAINSIKLSTLNETEMKKALEIWGKKWNDFIDKMLGVKTPETDIFHKEL